NAPGNGLAYGTINVAKRGHLDTFAICNERCHAHTLRSMQQEGGASIARGTRMANPMTAADTDSPMLPRRMSFEEWIALPEDEPGELVDGFLVEEEVPGYLHERVIAWLVQVLGTWGSPSGALVAGSGAKFRVTPRRGRMPDLTV